MILAAVFDLTDRFEVVMTRLDQRRFAEPQQCQQGPVRSIKWLLVEPVRGGASGE